MDSGGRAQSPDEGNSAMMTAGRLASASVCFVLLLLASVAPAKGESISLGVIGDSLSDEYQFQSYYYARNWLEQLVEYRGVNAGPIGTYPSPRNQSYAYNWALCAASSADAISADPNMNQADALAAQIVAQSPPNRIQHVIVAIGANDFSPFTDGYSKIYGGQWTPLQISNYVNGVIANINTALNTIIPTGVHVTVTTVPDYGIAPITQLMYPDEEGRQHVADAISAVNQGIKGLAQLDHIVVADLGSLITAVFGPEHDLHTTVPIGNNTIYLQQITDTSGNPHNAGFVHDSIHPNTILQGVMANLFAQTLKTCYGANLSLFTERELCGHAGLSYAWSDTLLAQIGPYTNYIIIPEPSVGSLAAAGALVLGLWRCRRRRCRAD